MTDIFRSSFYFSCCVLFFEGLSDPEEFVTVECVNTMMSLVEMGLMDKYLIFELIERTVPFLCHPNPWIRQAVVGFVCASVKTLSLVDVNARVAPLLETYVHYPISGVGDEVGNNTAFDFFPIKPNTYA